MKMLLGDKIILITILLSWLCIPSYCQQNLNFSQYMFNGLLVNPATVGSKEKISAGLFYRKQWVGMNGSPTLQSFSIQSPFNYSRMGIGLQVVNQTAFVEHITSATLSYAYRINIGKGRLSFGMEAGIIQGTVSLNSLKIKDQGDEVAASKANIIIPDLSTGLYYQTKKWNIGLSAKHLFSGFGNTNANTFNTPIPIKELYLFSSYNYKITKHLHVIPSVLFKYSNNIPVQADLNVHLKYNEVIWIGGSLRTSDAISMQAGVRLDQLAKGIRQEIRLGYAFDYPFTTLNSITPGSHEIVLIMDFELDKSPSQIRKSKKMVSPVFF
jgi:type IX secretion system PorP/SprF family membrane protein